MTRLSDCLFALASAAFLASAAVAQSAPTTGEKSAPAGSADASADDALAKTLFELNCSGCHELTMATTQRKAPEEWSATVAKMVDYGAPIAEADQPLIVRYLADHYAPSQP